MIYRKIGSTNLESSVIGFGSWQIGGELNIAGIPQSYGKIDETEAIRAIHFAVDNGINFFDTSDLYGLGKSESILGEELTGLREKVILCTKGGYLPDGINGTITDCSYEHIIAACNRSLKRLKTDYIDIYLLHFVPKKEQREESINALEKLKEAGKIRVYGISVAHNLELIPELSNNFSIIEGYYNLLLRKFEDFSDLISRKNIGFVAASPLSRGLLGEKNYDLQTFDDGDVRKKWKKGQPQHDWYIEQQQNISKLKELSSEWNISLKNLALSYILSNNIAVTIPGIKSENQIRELIESLNFIPLSKDKLEKIRAL